MRWNRRPRHHNQSRVQSRPHIYNISNYAAIWLSRHSKATEADSACPSTDRRRASDVLDNLSCTTDETILGRLSKESCSLLRESPAMIR